MIFSIQDVSVLLSVVAVVCLSIGWRIGYEKGRDIGQREGYRYARRRFKEF